MYKRGVGVDHWEKWSKDKVKEGKQSKKWTAVNGAG